MDHTDLSLLEGAAKFYREDGPKRARVSAADLP